MFKAVYAMFSGLGIVGIMAYIALWVGMLVGYFMNVFSVAKFFLSNAAINTIDTLMIGRIIGLFFAPLGGVLGYF